MKVNMENLKNVLSNKINLVLILAGLVLFFLRWGEGNILIHTYTDPHPPMRAGGPGGRLGPRGGGVMGRRRGARGARGGGAVLTVFYRSDMGGPCPRIA